MQLRSDPYYLEWERLSKQELCSSDQSFKTCCSSLINDIFESLQSIKLDKEALELRYEQKLQVLENAAHSTKTELVTLTQDHNALNIQYQELKKSFLESQIELSGSLQKRTKLEVESVKAQQEAVKLRSALCNHGDTEKWSEQIRWLELQVQSMTKRFEEANTSRSALQHQLAEWEADHLTSKFERERLELELSLAKTELEQALSEKESIRARLNSHAEEKTQQLTSYQRQVSSLTSELEKERVEREINRQIIERLETRIETFQCNTNNYQQENEVAIKQLQKASDQYLLRSKHLEMSLNKTCIERDELIKELTELQSNTNASLLKHQSDLSKLQTEKDDLESQLGQALQVLDAFTPDRADQIIINRDQLTEMLKAQLEELGIPGSIPVSGALSDLLPDEDCIILDQSDESMNKGCSNSISDRILQSSKLAEWLSKLFELQRRYELTSHQLIHQRNENRNMAHYFDQIEQELQRQCPILQDNRTRYDSMINELSQRTQELKFTFQKVETLESNLRQSNANNHKLEIEVEQLVKQLTYLIHNNKHKDQTKTFALLNTSDGFEDGDLNQGMRCDSNDSMADLSFDDVAGLIHRNRELNRLVFELQEQVSRIPSLEEELIAGHQGLVALEQAKQRLEEKQQGLTETIQTLQQLLESTNNCNTSNSNYEYFDENGHIVGQSNDLAYQSKEYSDIPNTSLSEGMAHLSEVPLNDSFSTYSSHQDQNYAEALERCKQLQVQANMNEPSPKTSADHYKYVLKDRIIELSEQLRIAQNATQGYDNDLIAVKAILEDTQEQRRIAENRITLLDKQLELKTSQLQQLESEFSRLQGEQASLDALNRSITTLCDQYQTQQEELRRRTLDDSQEWAHRLESMNDKMEELILDIHQKENKMNSMAEEISSREDRLLMMNSVISEKDAELKILQERNAQLQIAVAAHAGCKTKILNLTSFENTKRTDKLQPYMQQDQEKTALAVLSLQEELSHSKEHLSHVKALLNASQSQLEVLQKQSPAVIRKLENSLKEEMDSRKLTEAILADTKHSLKSRENELLRLAQALSSMQRSRYEADCDLDILGREIDVLRTSHQEHIQSISIWTDRATEATNKLNTYKNKLESTRDQLSRIRNDYEAHLLDCETTSAQLKLREQQLETSRSIVQRLLERLRSLARLAQYWRKLALHCASNPDVRSILASDATYLAYDQPELNQVEFKPPGGHEKSKDMTIGSDALLQLNERPTTYVTNNQDSPDEINIVNLNNIQNCGSGMGQREINSNVDVVSTLATFCDANAWLQREYQEVLTNLLIQIQRASEWKERAQFLSSKESSPPVVDQIKNIELRLEQETDLMEYQRKEIIINRANTSFEATETNSSLLELIFKKRRLLTMLQQKKETLQRLCVAPASNQ